MFNIVYYWIYFCTTLPYVEPLSEKKSFKESKVWFENFVCMTFGQSEYNQIRFWSDWTFGWIIDITGPCKISNFLPRDLQFWIGLHVPNKEERNRFKWESSCQEPVVAVWGESPLNTSNHRYCVFGSLRNSQVTMETSDCSQSEKMFMCEEHNSTWIYFSKVWIDL